MVPFSAIKIFVPYEAMEDSRTNDLIERLEGRRGVLIKGLRRPPEVPCPGLLRLPLELRLQIYQYCIPQKRIVDAVYPCFRYESPFVDRSEVSDEIQDKMWIEHDADLEGAWNGARQEYKFGLEDYVDSDQYLNGDIKYDRTGNIDD